MTLRYWPGMVSVLRLLVSARNQVGELQVMGQPVGAKEETKINLVRISDLDFL